MKIVYPYCVHCKKERGKHLAQTLHCPITSGRFPQFHKQQVFEVDMKRPVRVGFVI